MPKITFCKVCGKKCFNSKSGYCQKHSTILGKYKRTPEHKKLMRERLSGKPKEWLRGRKSPNHSIFLKKWWQEHPEAREKLRKRMQIQCSDKKCLEHLSALLSGENNPNWQGGLAQKKYKKFYQKLKDKIRKRDNFTCQCCGKTEKELGYVLSIHHIDFNKENSSENNLNALCKRCNSLINFDRIKWTQYFQNKLAITNGNGK